MQKNAVMFSFDLVSNWVGRNLKHAPIFILLLFGHSIFTLDLILDLKFDIPCCTALSWSPDSRMIAFPRSEDTVAIWDTQQEQELMYFEGDTYGINSLEWSPDGRFLAALGNRMIIWDLQNSQKLDILDFPENEANYGTLSWNSDGTMLAFSHWFSSSIDNLSGIRTRILELETGKVKDIGPIQKSTKAVLRWNPQNNLIALSDYTSLSIWNTDDEVLMEFNGLQEIVDLRWSPNGNYLAVAQNCISDNCVATSEIQIWDVESHSILKKLPDQGEELYSLDWSADSKLIVGVYSTGKLLIWDMLSEKPIYTKEIEHNELLYVDWSQNGNLIATGSNTGILIWDCGCASPLKQGR